MGSSEQNPELGASAGRSWREDQAVIHLAVSGEKKQTQSNWLNKGGSSLSHMERSPEAGGQLAWCDQWVRNHYGLCPLASSPRGYMRATRVPTSPADMTTSRVIEGPRPLRSFSGEPPLCSPSEDFPSLFPWPEPGHVSLLSQVPWGRLSGHRGCWQATFQIGRESQPDRESTWDIFMDGAEK